MQLPLNPFLVEGYISDKYFCDREEETKTLTTALTSGRNVTMISPRRMGKSGLIHHAFDRMRSSDSSARYYYIDIFHTHSLKDFIHVFANAVFGTLDTNLEKAFKTVMGVLKHCRPTIAPDMLTGAPTVTLTIDPGGEQPTLKDIFDYLNNSGKRIYIAMDEFQQIAEYPEKGVEAMLRALVQFSPNISFVFAGSKKHMMQEMFLLPSRPFYQSTQTMSLQPIERDAYREFCLSHMADGGKKMDPEAFNTVYDTVMGHTWYVQYWMSRIYDEGAKVVDAECATSILNRILREEDDNFYTYSQLMTKAQMRVMRGIARKGEIESPLSATELAELDMGAPSTVRSCIERLIEKELLLERQGAYSVYNRFFMLWLRLRN